MAGATSKLTDHDRARLRTTWRTTAAGPILGVLGAAAVGFLGAPGAAGLQVLLLLSATGCAVGAIVTGLFALIDEYRDRPVARRRPLTAVGLFAASVVLLVLTAGIGAE